MSLLKRIGRYLIPSNSVKKFIWEAYISILIRIQPLHYKLILKKTRKKRKVRIVFLMQLASSWKYDYLFRLLLNNQRFDPLIVICPIIKYDNDIMLLEMNRAIDFFSQQSYPVISTWNPKSQKWMDVRRELNPDIVFFSNPWAELSKNEYYIFNFLDKLTCYAPYGFKTSHLYEAIFNKPFQNLLWKIFYETDIHKGLAAVYARNKGVNGIVTGYPGMDVLLDESHIPAEEWKYMSNVVKRIIWAPHHSIFGRNDSNVGFSTFLKYSDIMLLIASEYKDRIQISFKPHPLLRPKLYDHPEWGKFKTDSYFKKWSSNVNTQLNEGNYNDLFLTSDAIINDGESFMVEYLYTKKPSMFLVADERITDRFNEFGKLVFEQLYHGHNEMEIRKFIEEVVIEGNDYKLEDRIFFFERHVKPPNNKTASENLFYIIKSSIIEN